MGGHLIDIHIHVHDIIDPNVSVVSDTIERPMGPWIHTGMELVVRKQALSRSESDAYSLWWVENGSVQIEAAQRKRRIPTPCGVLLSPGDDRIMHLGGGACWCMVRFDLIWRPLTVLRGTDCTVYRPVDQRSPQPPLAELWQRTIPAPLPVDACRGLRQVLTRCSTTCMRGSEAWYRANHLLGPWLIGLRDELRPDGTAPTTRARLADLARQHIVQGLTVEQLAQLMGIGAIQLNRRLRQEDPQSPPAGEIVRAVRLDELRRELVNTDKPLGTLAKRCGYRSTTVLINDFKRAEGMTPGAWRKQYRRQADHGPSCATRGNKGDTPP